MTRAAFLGVAAALGAAGCGDGELTEIVVVSDTDLDVPGEIDRIEIQVEEPVADPATAGADLAGEQELPVVVGVVNRRNDDAPLAVVARGMRGGTVILERRARTRFVPGETRILRLDLFRSCVGRMDCSAAESCSERGCVPIETGTEPFRPPGRLDGGGPPDDAGDAMPPPDADVDGGCPAELCNGRDDDCDGRADESFDLRVDEANCGACGHGCLLQMCVDRVCEGQPVALAVGRSHACALDTTGAARCWGDNASGQLGDGTMARRMTPTPVLALAGEVLQIAAGEEHICARLGSGVVRCWGKNDKGQLGDGSMMDRPTPVGATGIVDAVDLAAGGAHTCAISGATGAVSCWGHNDRLQLGQTGDGESELPVAVVGLPAIRAVDLAAGARHSCAVLEGGEVWCWGDDGSSQIDGPPADAPGPPRRVPLMDGGTARSVTAGELHTCAVLTGGAAQCWGANMHGQTGRGSLGGVSAPAAVVSLGDLLDLSAGGEHTCAVRGDGVAFCWGRGDHGRLGDPETTMDAPAPLPLAGTDWVRIAAGASMTCARRVGGRVACWGEGFLGDGTAARESPMPVEVLLP